jgi:hypothetical protein
MVSPLPSPVRVATESESAVHVAAIRARGLWIPGLIDAQANGRLSIMNLGWVVAHDQINRANSRRIPVILNRERQRKDPSAELARLARRYLGPRSAATRTLQRPDPAQYLAVQLDTLRRMSDDLKSASYRENFKYIVYRSLHLMASLRVSDFGDNRLFKPSEMPTALGRRQRQ